MNSIIEKPFYVISSSRLLLAPYLNAFIPEYHKWMEDPETLYLTGSEPLTLEEEILNQKSWLMDPKKYTFIICIKEGSDNLDVKDFSKLNTEKFIENYDWKSKCRPIGDVNLFFHEYIEDNEAEIDIMIGNKGERGKGFASEAVKIMMEFGYFHYKKDKFIAKIKSDNENSKKLFEKLGYTFIKEVKVFDECVYEFDCKIKNQSPKEFYKLDFEEYETKIA